MTDIVMGRRALIAGAVMAAASGCAPRAATPIGTALPALTDAPLYGLIGQLRATPGMRDRLIYLMLDGAVNMPGCLSYVIATDPSDPDAIWVTEAWDSAASHRASLDLFAVKEAIRRARPLIAAFVLSHQVVPVGGIGLKG